MPDYEALRINGSSGEITPSESLSEAPLESHEALLSKVDFAILTAGIKKQYPDRFTKPE